ncbi:MAG: class I SAM-dependent methyltransferase family protein [Thermoprotei archaeon]|nr:MAG: class I SAM-dependent methyltransferase family protein [Thermoprotei archaeon]
MPENPILEAAKEVFPEELLRYVIKSFDVVGDIMVIKVPPQLMEGRFRLAEALLKKLPYVKVVVRQASPHEGDYRLRGLEWLAGERRTETVHKEYGCRYKVDLAKTFFTPRLSYERLRVAKLVREGEVVFNMFAGVGCFSVLIAKLAGAEVYSVDVNPEAVRLMYENVKLNKVEGLVHVVHGDSRSIGLSCLEGKVDRVLMPLPLKSYEFLDAAIASLRGRGVIHYYDVERGRRDEVVSKLWRRVEVKIEELGARCRLLGARIVREVGPRLLQAVLDVEVSR